MQLIFQRFLWMAGLLLAPLQAQAGAYQDFLSAVQRDDVASVKSLVQRGVDVNTIDPAGFPALTLAIRDQSLKVAEFLLEQPNLRLDQLNAVGEDALMYAALNGYEKLVQRLIQLGAPINKTGWTALHYAATHGHTEICQLLLDESAYIDAESPNRTTPLMMAANFMKRATVLLLIKEGADPTLKNDAGLSAADFAARTNDQELAAWLRRREEDFRLRHPASSANHPALSNNLHQDSPESRR